MLDTERLRQRLSDEDPAFARAVRTYVGEATFFHPLVSRDLDPRSPSTVVEVGAGIGLLATLLAADGHRVTAFEPQSAGFDRNHAIRAVVLDCWDGDPPPVTRHDTYFDAGLLEAPPDLAVSINVVEHVEDPVHLVGSVVEALGPGGTYRVVCPNYAVPYEPHFNLPTLFDKRLTERVLGGRIRAADKPDPQGLWDELSWPTQRGLARGLDAAGLDATFGREATLAYVRRVGTDPSFVERKGPRLAAAVERAGGIAEFAARRLPLAVLPIIDARIRRR